jgi:hypothetical protein
MSLLDKREQYKIGINKFIPGIAWFFLIAFLMLLPGKDIPQVGWLEDIHFDKWVHTGSFMIMSFLFSWIFYKTEYAPAVRLNYFIKIAVAASIWGLVIEFLQKFYIPGRSYDLLDWLADSVGSFIGLLLSIRYLKEDRRFFKK